MGGEIDRETQKRRKRIANERNRRDAREKGYKSGGNGGCDDQQEGGKRRRKSEGGVKKVDNSRKGKRYYSDRQTEAIEGSGETGKETETERIVTRKRERERERERQRETERESEEGRGTDRNEGTRMSGPTEKSWARLPSQH